MADYPDWTRLFYLTGTAITIPINIESSDITLDVNLVGSDIQMDVNIAAAAVTLDFNFADQSVAVFDAAKWFAHNAAQVYVYGVVSVASGGLGITATRTVPAGKVFFITHIGWGQGSTSSCHVLVFFEVDGSRIFASGQYDGGSAILDTPIRATAGQVCNVKVAQDSGGSTNVFGSLGGYDEVV